MLSKQPVNATLHWHNVPHKWTTRRSISYQGEKRQRGHRQNCHFFYNKKPLCWLWQIDPQILFQRLMLIAANGNMNTEDMFSYELCMYSTSLFDSPGVPRLANKAALADSLLNHIQIPAQRSISNPLHVLDGGFLLHRILWSLDVSFQEICDDYKRYVCSKYGKCMVVFDGYTDDPTVKDMTHQRRRQTNYVDVNCERSTKLTVKKDIFLWKKRASFTC